MSETETMPERPMTAAEFRIMREHLNLTAEAVGGLLGVSDRTVRHWEAGKYAVPVGVAHQVRRLVRDTDHAVEKMAEHLELRPDDVVQVYRTDPPYEAAAATDNVLDVVVTASWHRAVVARAVAGRAVRVEYGDA